MHEDRVKPEVLLRAHGLSMGFGNQQVLENVSFSLRAGEVLGLIGANGGGKTTTLRLLAGLLSPTAGHLTVLSKELPRHARTVQRQIAYVSQKLSLHRELTVRENLSFQAAVYGVAEPDVAVDSALKQFVLYQHASTRVEDLSGGWERLAQLAAGCMHDPRIFLLDEPTAGLDATTRSLVWAHIGRLAVEGAGVIISTHDLEEATRCDQLLFYAGGKIRANGSPAKILSESNASVFLLKNNDITPILQVLHSKVKHLSLHQEQGALRIVVDNSELASLKAFAQASGSHLSSRPLTLTDASGAFLAEARR